MTARAELAAAVAAVNAAYARLPIETRESIDIEAGSLDRLLDRALLDGDRDDARDAIRLWRDHYLRLFAEVRP